MKLIRIVAKKGFKKFSISKTPQMASLYCGGPRCYLIFLLFNLNTAREQEKFRAFGSYRKAKAEFDRVSAKYRMVPGMKKISQLYKESYR